MARYEKDAIYIPAHDPYEREAEHCDRSPMIKTAQYTSRRLAHSAPVKRASWTNTYHVRNLHASTRHYQGPSVKAEISGGRNVAAYKMAGNTENKPPKHEMVHFKGLLNTQRRFGDFRTVLHTGLYSQLVAMEVPVNGEIGDEVHTVDQILLFTSGRGLATVAGKDQEVQAGDVVVVPAGTQHQFVTVGDRPLELVTVYSPAEHMVDTVHRTKELGDQAEDEGRDEAPAWSRRSKRENEDAGLVRLSGKYENE